jgi:drug/metabolite transporter (DMT)-like permease
MDSQGRPELTGVYYALGAALLFGASTPFTKALGKEIDPVLLAGLLYLASGIGLALARAGIRRWRDATQREAGLTRRDLPWFAGAVVAGGIVGPVLLMVGLRETSGASASLLLNLESVFTALVAWFVFRENFDRRIALGMALITAGGVVLATGGRLEIRGQWGALAIAGACLAWALDNNLTKKVSASDPVQIALLKGLVAGTVNTLIGIWRQPAIPPARVLLGVAVVGFLGYGISLVAYVFALRHVGSARTGAYFSLAPFLGAGVAIAGFREPLTTTFAIGAALMASGIWLHVTERHDHDHVHEQVEHDHVHSHDEHHQHAHDPGLATAGPHGHPHRHELMVHRHPHYPDIHHLHPH